MHSTDADTRMNAVGAVMNLCSSSSDNRARISKEPEAVCGLLGLLNDQRAEVRKYATIVLGKLAGAKFGVPSPGGIVPPPAADAVSAGEAAVAEPVVAGGGPVSAVAAAGTYGSDGFDSALVSSSGGGCWSLPRGPNFSPNCGCTSSASSNGMKGTAVVSKLVALLQDEDVGVRTQAATVLRTLSRSPSSQARISVEEAFSPGVLLRTELLQASSMSMQQLLQHCLLPGASATAKLSAVAELCRRVATAEGRAAVGADAALQSAVVTCMVAMLQDPLAAYRKQAAGVLWGLCTNHAGNQATVGQQPGAIAALVSLLKDAVPGVARQALGVLSALSKHNVYNQTAIAWESGAVKAILDVLKDEQAAEAARRLAASLLLDLSSNEGTRPRVVRELPPGAASLLWRFTTANASEPCSKQQSVCDSACSGSTAQLGKWLQPLAGSSCGSSPKRVSFRL